MHIPSLLQRALVVASLLTVAACQHLGFSRGPKRPPLVTAANVALGDSLFNNGGCQRCHGKGAVGAANAPALDGKKWLQLKTGSYDEMVKLITDGVAKEAIKDPAHKFPMRGRGGQANYTDAQVQALAAYVWTLSHK
jgi:mono/diheme cytochrome c family protein